MASLSMQSFGLPLKSLVVIQCHYRFDARRRHPPSSDESSYDSLVHMHRAVAMNDRRPYDSGREEGDGSGAFASADVNFLLVLSLVGIFIVATFLWKVRPLRFFGRGKVKSRRRVISLQS